MNAQKLMRGTAVLTTAAAAVLGFQSAAQAHSAPGVVYVTPNLSGSAASAAQRDGGRLTHVCPDMGVHSIQRGVDVVATGGKVVVCPGTYKESVNITKRLMLEGLRGAVVDATRQSYGIGIGANQVTVTGMTVRNAGVGADPNSGPLGDGIVTVSLAGYPRIGNYATITKNTVTGNLGGGIDVNSSRGGLIQANHADGNGIGINVNTDLSHPVRDNKIIGNTANGNLTGCGIAVADHSGAGVINNLVKNNVANGNGLPAGGAGVLLAEPTPGGILKDNTFVGNSASGNGHSGFELHVHVPDAHVTGNSVVGNDFGSNNSGGDFSDGKTTGIYLGSASPMTIVVKDNQVHDDFYGIFQAGPVHSIKGGNTFTRVTHPFRAIGTYAG